MANAELNVILSADGKQLAATMAKAEKDVQVLESELSTLPAAFAQVDKGANKSTAALSKAAAQAEKASKKIKDIAPATVEVGDALQKLQNDLGGLDFSGKFAEAQARLDASIDAMAASALTGGEAIEKMGIEASQAAPKFTQLQTAVTRFGGGVLAFSRANFNLVHGIKESDSQLKKLPSSSNRATESLTNLGRVAQDAPFGFLGIANNINPLLESFQRLKKETGSTKGALKSLVSGLGGVGGLGLAVSVASSLLIVFGDKLFGASKKSQEAAAKIKETTDRVKELLKPLSELKEDAVAGTAEELSKVTALSKAVLDQTKSYGERNNALNQLKKINESYFGDLTLETSKLGVLRDRVNEYTQAIISAATIKAFSDEIGKLAVELSKQDRAFNEAGKNLDKYNKILANTKESETSLTGEDRISSTYVKAKKDVKSATTAFNDQAKVVGSLRDQMFNLRTSIQEAVDFSLDLRPLEVTKIDTQKTEVDKFYNDLIKRAKAFESFINSQTIRVANFEVDPSATRAETIKKAQDFIERALMARETFSLKPQILVENPVLIKSQSYFASLVKEADGIFKDLQEEINKLTKRNPILISATTERDKQNARGAEFFQALGIPSADENAPKSLLTDTQKAAVNLANVMNQTVVPAFDDLFNAIKAGENPIKAFFQGLGQAIQQLLQKLLQAVIQAALLSAITGGTTSFGAAFKSLIGFRAEGGPVFANKPYVVGERGPELFIPQGGGRIIPNNEMNSGLSAVTGASSGFIAETRISARELRIILARQEQYNQRNV